VEKVRKDLGKKICHQYADEENRLSVLTLAHDIEVKIVESGHESAEGRISALHPQVQKAWLMATGHAIAAVKKQGLAPVILCSWEARPLVKNSTQRHFPDLPVLSIPEVSADIVLQVIGTIRLEGQEQDHGP
jgi:flagellar biosynthesis protein FlhA